MDLNAFSHLSCGMYIVSASWELKRSGCLINTAMWVTNTPMQVSVTVNKDNFTCSLIEKSGLFALQPVTQEADMKFLGRFGFRSGRDMDKYQDLSTTMDKNGCPMLTNMPEVSAWFSVKVTGKLEVGTHIIFVGEVQDAGILNDKPPMTYAYYHQVKGGKTPPKAASYLPGSH